ncbi:reverse transcriptase domain-containing protein [Tanacetum coccineum]
MRTRSQSRNSNRQQQQVNPTFVEPFNLVEPIENQAPPVVTMDDNRTMAQLLEAPTVGYEDAIVVPEITADNFELKHGLLTLNHFYDNFPTSRVTRKAYAFPHISFRGCRSGFGKEPPSRSILTWDDLVSKFINKFFPPSKTTNLRNEITRFQQRFDETFYEAWDRFNDLLRACPHHGFSELHQLDTFYNALNSNDQDSLNSAAGGDKHTVPPTNNGSTKDVQPPVAQDQPQVPNSKPVVAPVSAPMPNPNSTIPYPSRHNDERRREKANDQIEKFYEIFKDLSFEISLTDALILMPKFASTLKALIGNKEKLSEMARTPLNEHCSAVILNKLPEKLGDPDKFLIPCDFPGMDECLALADLGASINLMPLSMWKKLSLPELTPTCMTLELADRSITQPIGIAEDVDVKVGKFQFSADFVVVDFDADPRVPLILGRSFLKTGRALIDVYEGELTLRVGKEAVTFNLDQTSRYSSNYDDMTANRIDVIEMACEEYSQEVLGFSDVIASGNPTPYYDPIVSTSSLTLTPFGDSDFLLEEVDAFLALEDDPTSPKVDDSYYDPEGDILLLESFLNDDPSLPPPTQGNYLLEIIKRTKFVKLKTDKSLIDEPPQLPVIIAKDLSVEEKAALIKVLKSHKRAIAWKLSDIKGINPEFCTHKILMEEDYKPAVQHQRRVNPKIHDVIKKEVEKLLECRINLPDLDSPCCKAEKAVDILTALPYVDPLGDNTMPTYTDKKFLRNTFDVWGIDFMRSFPSSRGNKYILVAVDYLSKWVKAIALPTNDARVVCKFLKSLFARFGAPRATKSDCGTHFCNDQFAKVMLKYGVTHRLSIAYHPQKSRQVEVSNRGLKRILKRTVGEKRASWSDKLDDALWAFRTTYKTPIGCTPYKFVKRIIQEKDQKSKPKRQKRAPENEKTMRAQNAKSSQQSQNVKVDPG